MKDKFIYLIIFIFIIVFSVYYKKDNFYNIQESKNAENDLYFRPSTINNVVPANKNVNVTVNDLSNLLKELLNVNGPPGGANVNVTQNKYDMLFKDIIVSSDKRNVTKYPNPNNYNIYLNLNIDKIYKAELIDVYIPAATDDAVNVPTFANRLYFNYKSTVIGYITIQAGTYMSPNSIAIELTRQFNIILTNAGIVLTTSVGVSVIYDKNLNRYIFKDRDISVPGTLIIYTENGYIIDANNTVTNSINLMLNEGIYISGPMYIDSTANGILYVKTAVPGDYGEFNGTDVPLNTETLFGNCVISEVVLTHCKLYLSLGKLNGNTCNIVTNDSTRNVPDIFCQIPNNTSVSSAAVKTLLNQPHNFSAIQFYNPPISKINKLEIKWYTDNGTLVRILDHCFTIRIYYFQKRIDTTDFSYPIP
jgi:hypothetical protein